MDKMRVGNLQPGQVISLPETGLGPSVIVGIATAANTRFIDLIDLDTGEPVESRLALGTDRLVIDHKVTAAHHHYRNASDEVLNVTVGNRVHAVEPGASLHFTGAHHQERFPETDWEHTVEPFEVAAEVGPL